ncbi:hypothetical protein [Streptomyces antibioticus]|uniref:hypothetical protein n=1 Tax=Streptomyces antibioticus TaxID=1890 RepID=UPI0033AE2EB1
MSTDEQAPASGSVPNAYGNALAWKWVPSMPAALKRAHVHTLLYALRSMASASGELRFADRKPMTIKAIARAAGADEKDARDRLEAAIRAGVVAAPGERRRGRTALYVIVPTPCPDWPAAVAYLDGVKAAREDARKRREGERRAAPWDNENGGRSPEPTEPENGGPPPELPAPEQKSERGTAPRTRTGDRPPNGSGDRPPNNPGGYPWVSHDRADAVPQPQVDGPPEEHIDHQEHHHPEHPDAGPPPTATAGRCRKCQIPLIRPGRDLCHGCETYLATTNPERHTA